MVFAEVIVNNLRKLFRFLPMRTVHRLSQYQRLYQQLGNAPVAVTIGELAAMFYCSERHARTLVQQLQDQGWLSWHSQPGRGKRARLHCLKTPDELRAQLLQQRCNRATIRRWRWRSSIRCTCRICSARTSAGNGRQAGSPTLRIPYYTLDASTHSR